MFKTAFCSTCHKESTSYRRIIHANHIEWICEQCDASREENMLDENLITVKYFTRDSGYWDKRIMPTWNAISELLEQPVPRLTIKVAKSGQFAIMNSFDDGILISHEDFKKLPIWEEK